MNSSLPEITGLDGDLPEGKIAIIASRYNPAICDKLVAGAVATLTEAGYPESSILVVRVPGAWELPTIVQTVLDHQDVIAAIALGCVIKGETTHDEHINRAVSLSLMEMGVDTGIPIAFGLLTCNTLEQAIQRSGGNVGNKGNESAEAILELLRLNEKLSK
ncbi:6,7-dimethyl-8-ribityllumazine synthase [Rubripirellula amarantea]|uniref:6,7-dimethyl-8-ribityllumazine synthase n=1 Tax=Rubripirellula amarantea TaxID=2527999 RepID=A0A5C5WDE2_9BACT|nr:6,7-dimethyl-8-ribityllumazine synthase [Rubripirellula amarantea]MDA8743506.1 6,7-dimethyl-8-ribityllumazine synthase [Rubripirellula amarantea]TWT48069.1 6,7-dimethyl-8-ribityllumazine synthase [Rubripirellula amarantea]